MSTAVPGAATPAAAAAAAMPDVFARDAIISWFRGEFAAANAIIDALCGHLVQIDGDGGGAEYQEAFAALHRRRMNWFPVLHMQKFFSIADVATELRRVAASRAEAAAVSAIYFPEETVEIEKGAEQEEVEEIKTSPMEEETDGAVDGVRVSVVEEADEGDSSGDSSDRKATDEEGGADRRSQGEQNLLENVQICSDHEDCMARPERIKTLKGFVAKESVKGHMVNVVKGLKVYEDIFTDSELLRLSEFISELRQAGRRGELSGETFIFFNKQMKGNKREIIQLGVPLFQPTSEEATSSIEPMPLVLQAVIDHLVQWRLIPESRKPNSCIINFFDEDEYSHPYFKPPHLDNPISTLLLSETNMAFGRALVSDHSGNYKGPLTLSLKEGSFLVMRGNSADMARHVVCPSSNRRVSITFVKVRPAISQSDSSPLPSPTKAMTIWQPETPTAQKVSSGGVIGYGPHAMIPTAWGMALRAPLVMLAPARPMVMSPSRKMARSGTGVFLPWTVGPKKYIKHLPPRIQKRRFPSLPSPVEVQG
ncbi:RNA demethylase ALKBH10B-like [Typha latifolia]|uniref:RNA demethylase ALKBH10B-like n=1 Tax=Typha latifolia TaxID=4733 RepID=UPI003C2D6C24